MDCYHVPIDKFLESPEIIVQKDDILLTKDGTIGKVAYVGDMPGGKATLNAHILLIRNLENNEVHPRYTYYLLQSHHFLSYVTYAQTGTTRPSLPQNKFERFSVPLPSLKEQKRIVSKIEELFSIIDFTKHALEKIKTLLKQYRQSLLKSAFEGKLTVKWRNDNNRIIEEEKEIQNEIYLGVKVLKKNTHQEHGTLHINRLFEIPNEWVWARFDNIGKIGQGGTPSTSVTEYWNGDIPWLRSGDVKNNFIRISNVFITKLGLQNSSTTLCPSGTVLLAMTGEGLTRGRSAVLEIEACANQSVTHIIVHKKYILNKFLFYYLQSQYWKIRSVHKGSNQPGLNVSIIKQFEIPIPSISEQGIIVQKIEEGISSIENDERIIDLSLKNLEELRNTVLNQAFEGKLVFQDPNDKPAEILLQKIKQEKEKLKETQKVIKAKPIKSRRTKIAK